MRIALVLMVLCACGASAMAGTVLDFPLDLTAEGIYSDIELGRNCSFLLAGDVVVYSATWYGFYGRDTLPTTPPVAFLIEFADYDPVAGGPAVPAIASIPVLATAVDTGFKAASFVASPDAPIYRFEATFAPVTLPGGITHTFLLGETDDRTPHVGTTQWLWNRSTVPGAFAFTLGGRTAGSAVPLPSAAGAGIVLLGGLALLRRRHRCQR